MPAETPTQPAAVRDTLTEDEAAAFIGFEPQTLAVWRSTGRHDLPFVRVGRSIRYRRADLEAWLDAHTVGKRKPCRLASA